MIKRPHRRGVPMTRLKIAGARLCYHLLRPLIGSNPRIVERGGVRLELIPSEGVDFALLLFGSFQRHVLDPSRIELPEDGVAIDVGAHIGSVTLELARRLPHGRVFAFEPADINVQRLHRNLALNPSLAPRVTVTKAFLSDRPSRPSDHLVFGRWPLATGDNQNRHPLHRGVLESATATPMLTLDEFVEERAFKRVDFIKVDTDGHEVEVLLGARKALERFEPAVVFEIGGYGLEEAGWDFSDIFEIFTPLGYRLQDLKSGREVTEKNARGIVPGRATTDLLALPLR